jgi:hypothetical protein
MQLGCFR